MNNLKQIINEDIKAAMFAKNTVAKDILRVVKGDIERAEQTSKGKVVVSEEDVVKLVKKTIQGIKDTSNNEEEIAILSKYLPIQLTVEQIRDKVTTIISELNATSMKDMGRVMGTFNSKYSGMADGKIVSDMVKENLL